MTKNIVRGLAALSLTVTPLVAPPAQAAPGAPTETTTLADAVHRIPAADENRDGYTSARFRHWNAGAKADGCDTGAEVLIAEASEAPSVRGRCRITGGEWLSYFDAQEVEGTRGLDVAHLVPLAEAWDSGASEWGAGRREAYANDLGAPASLVAVTARTHRARAAKDPSQWLPPQPSAHCRYVSEWVATKLRWDLAADPAELDALAVFGSGPCKHTVVRYKAVR